MFSLSVCALFSHRFFGVRNIKVSFSLGFGVIQQ